MEQFGCNVDTSEKDQKYSGSFEMWCWRKMEISWTDHVKNDLDLQRVKNETNILHTMKRRKANWMGHILHRNCLLKYVIEGKVTA
jgi:hypothetical protein